MKDNEWKVTCVCVCVCVCQPLYTLFWIHKCFSRAHHIFVGGILANVADTIQLHTHALHSVLLVQEHILLRPYTHFDSEIGSAYSVSHSYNILLVPFYTAHTHTCTHTTHPHTHTPTHTTHTHSHTHPHSTPYRLSMSPTTQRGRSTHCLILCSECTRALTCSLHLL